MGKFVLYLFTLCASFACTYAALPLLVRWFGNYFLDKPGGLKTHTGAVPVVGGSAIFLGLTAALVCVRLTTQFPSGTLHSLRGIIFGGALIFAMGLWDDFTKPKGLPVWIKLLVQATATLCLIRYGILIRVFPSLWVSYLLTFLWIVGLTNAFNLLDILDGLCTTQALVCTLGLTLITLPSERIYVNFAALALVGACGAFLPFNFSAKRKVFLGDSGSNLLGFWIAALCLATGYSGHSDWGFLAPLLIAFVPIFDTSFVTLFRLKQGKNPLKGSPDHAALLLKSAGWNTKKIVTVFLTVALVTNTLGFCLTLAAPRVAMFLLLGVACAAGWAAYMLGRIGVKHAR